MSIRPTRRRLAVALAGLSLLGLPRGLLAEEGRYVVVGRDGAVTSLAAPPERKGDRFVGRLFKGGQLVSFAAAEVDDVKTAEANSPRPVPTVRPDTNVLKRTPAASPDSRKLRVRREEAEQSLGSVSGTGGRPAEPGGVARAPAPPPVSVVDGNGHGEAWWQKRAAPINARAARAESEVTRVAASRDAWQRSPGAGTPAWQVRLHRLQEAVSKAQAKLDEALRQQDRLSEDARKAGAYPGWIR